LSWLFNPGEIREKCNGFMNPMASLLYTTEYGDNNQVEIENDLDK